MMFSLFKKRYQSLPRARTIARGLFLIASAICLYPTSLYAERGAVVLSDVYLMADPSASASQLFLLEEDSTVKLLMRKGGWYQVKTAGDQTGWVRMLKVRYMIEQEENERSIAKILRETAAMPPASGISTGVRGISEATLEQEGEPGIELENMDKFVPTEESIDGFGRDRKLKSIDELELQLEQ